MDGTSACSGSGKFAGDTVGRDADRLKDVLQRVLNNWTATAFAEQDSNARTIDRRPHNAVHGGQVETQFARVFRT